MRRCPRCHYDTLAVYADEMYCDRCGYLNRMDFWVEPAPAAKPLAREDPDEGWGEAASTFVRQLDDAWMTELSS